MSCTCGNSKKEPTRLQKREKEARKKWIHYRKIENKSPDVLLWSKEKAKAYSKSQSQTNEKSFVQRTWDAFKGAKQEKTDLRQKVLALEQEVFDLQAQLNKQGLPMLPLT